MAKVTTCVRKLPPHLFLCHVLYPFSKYSCTTMTWSTYTKNNNTTLYIFWFFSCAGDTNILKHTRSWMHVLMLKGYCHVYKLDLSPLEVLWDWLFSHRALSWSKLVVFEIWIMIIIISLPIRLYSKFHTFCTIGIHDMHKSRRRRTKERTYGIFKCIYYAIAK